MSTRGPGGPAGRSWAPAIPSLTPTRPKGGPSLRPADLRRGEPDPDLLFPGAIRKHLMVGGQRFFRPQPVQSSGGRQPDGDGRIRKHSPQGLLDPVDHGLSLLRLSRAAGRPWAPRAGLPP